MLDLTVRTTHDCNMSCSFCHLKDEMKDKSVCDNLPEVVENFIRQNEHIGFSGFNIAGGEPLSNMSLMQDILDVFLSYDENADIRILTNASLISNLYTAGINEFKNINTCMSLGGLNKPEKSLQDLIKASPFGLSVLDNIRALKNLSIKMVVLDFKDNELPLEILSLASIFPQANIELAPDYETLHLLSIKDTLAVTTLISRLKALNLRHRVSFTGFFTSECDCTNSKIILPNGDILNKAHEESDDFAGIGCSHFKNKMGADLYKIFTRIIKKTDV